MTSLANRSHVKYLTGRDEHDDQPCPKQDISRTSPGGMNMMANLAEGHVQFLTWCDENGDQMPRQLVAGQVQRITFWDQLDDPDNSRLAPEPHLMR
jgi:hypothetical protein